MNPQVEMRMSKKDLMKNLNLPVTTFYRYLKIAESHSDFREDCNFDYKLNGFTRYQVWLICQLVKDFTGQNKTWLRYLVCQPKTDEYKILSKVSYQEFKSNYNQNKKVA